MEVVSWRWIRRSYRLHQRRPMPAGLVCCARKKIFRTLPLTSDNAHRDCLRSRHVAALGVMPERDQRVAFRVIRGAAALRDVVARRAQSVPLALDSVIRDGGKADHFALT